MQDRNKYLLLTSLFLLTSCNSNIIIDSTVSLESSSVEESFSTISLSSSLIEESKSIEESSSIIESTIEESSSLVNEDRTIDIYAINDFHGSVVENGSEVGIVRLGSFLKEKKDNDNTLLINSGDMFQGSIESNYNYGELLTKCNNYIGFDSFVLGNHEFDWGVSYINNNRNIISSNYQVPYLAANVYNYDLANNKVLDYADLGDKYTIKTLENGLKVGIIGVIGKDQITSISSQFVDDLVFVDPTNIIKELSDELRIKEECDVVLLSSHASQWDILDDSNYRGVDNTGITSISSVSNKRYVDAIFCAHSHANEKEMINGVPVIQSSCNGKMYANVSLVVSPNGKITCNTYENYYSSSISKSAYNDSYLNELVNEYKSVSDNIGNELLATFSGNFKKSDNLIKLMDKAMYEMATLQGYDVDYALCNQARANLSGSVTYANLYKSFPFDNEVYIATISGKDLLKEIKTIGMYRNNKEAIDENKTYTIAVIDYLAFHRNSNREYDYMPSINVIGKLTKEGKQIYNYRDVLADYLRNQKGNINVNDYSSSLDCFNVSKIYQNI